MNVAVLALAVLAGAASAPPQQFDLNCSGVQKFDLLAAGTPIKFTLHVDLVGKRWCEDACAAVNPIAQVQPAFIAFQQESDEQKALGQFDSRVVSRLNGTYLQYVRDRRRTIAVDAQCESAAFTGFPNVQTKF